MQQESLVEKDSKGIVIFLVLISFTETKNVITPRFFFGIYGGFKLGVDKIFHILSFFMCQTRHLERHAKLVTYL